MPDLYWNSSRRLFPAGYPNTEGVFPSRWTPYNPARRFEDDEDLFSGAPRHRGKMKGKKYLYPKGQEAKSSTIGNALNRVTRRSNLPYREGKSFVVVENPVNYSMSQKGARRWSKGAHNIVNKNLERRYKNLGMVDKIGSLMFADSHPGWAAAASLVPYHPNANPYDYYDRYTETADDLFDDHRVKNTNFLIRDKDGVRTTPYTAHMAAQDRIAHNISRAYRKNQAKKVLKKTGRDLGEAEDLVAKYLTGFGKGRKKKPVRTKKKAATRVAKKKPAATKKKPAARATKKKPTGRVTKKKPAGRVTKK